MNQTAFSISHSRVPSSSSSSSTTTITMSTQAPLKLLEIHVISAHELPPVSKMLRTFVVAYLHPDNKLTTRIDHQGHTNPTWNYKVSFHVDDDFLKNDSSAVTIEIYNLAWLRDLPIGTARLTINSLSPPLVKNPGFRRVSVRVCRPSGHLQGTLNLGVQLVDSVVPGREIRIPPSVELELYEEDEERDHQEQETNEDVEKEDLQDQETIKYPTRSIHSSSSTVSSSKITRPESEAETKTAITSAAGSFYSVMRPLPSEVASDMKKGLYSADCDDYGSWIFDNWTEMADRSSEDPKAETEQWPFVENEVPLTSDKELLTGFIHRPKRPEKKKKKGLFSCFGNAYGVEFSFMCGSKGMKMKKKKKSRNVDKHSIHLMSLPHKYI